MKHNHFFHPTPGTSRRSFRQSQPGAAEEKRYLIRMIDENFIREWINYQQETLNDDDAELHWTDDYLINLMLEGQIDELWEFVMRPYRKELSQPVISILAAGALEDVLAAKGEEYIGRVELLASNDPKFKYLLGGVWQNAMSDEVWSRIKQVAEPWV